MRSVLGFETSEARTRCAQGPDEIGEMKGIYRGQSL